MKILLPIDTSNAALAPIPHLAALARRHADVDILLLNVQPRFHRHIAQFVGRAARDAFRARRSRAALAPAIERLRAAGIRFRVIVETGERAACIAAVAEREAVDEIALGVSRHSAWMRWLMPSVAAAVTARTEVGVTLFSAVRSTRIRPHALPAA